ncbi:leucine-rich repeat domain-containing protein [Flagellimonas sp. 389]|uniref:leucine-rich repeat domain-containing protein n=1 Tax=Flagellimonas sp. 389 TaxID=2835862 RepID=UPI001BD4523A|nr:leucine-rich repeat domain-containing protein [Flagellimonas sp. 389]MBS9462856.1 leucine-rich repeat domain-containing protein [Flagellimonas sp. 389]
MKKINILFLSLFVLASCSKDDDNGTANSSAKAITAFVFTTAENETLSADVKATIDEEKKTVTAELPAGTAVTSLKPSITISEDAKVTPGDKEAKDFSEAVAYTVTAEDGTEAKYTVTVTIGESGAKAITSFQFLQEDNDGLSENIEAAIDETEKTVLARVPFGTDVTALKPVIAISAKASIDPEVKEAVDFSQVVTYTVTAEDGTETNYTVEVEVLKGDRQVLIDIYNANPNSNLGWDLEDDDIANWKGVTIENGRVVALLIDSNTRGINILPSSIGDLTQLRSLSFDSTNLTTLPAEIGKLQSLESLNLGWNEFEEIPEEIGQLINLKELYLEFNPELQELPASLGNLINLEKLTAYETGQKVMPSWIGNLKNLEYLDLSYNTIEVMPSWVGSLKKLDTLYLEDNKIKALPPEIGNLTALRELKLSENELKELPQEFGNLTSLSSLYLGDNLFAEIPSVITKLNTLTYLLLYNNKIATLSLDLFSLTNLGYLSLSGNALTSIPGELGQLSQLEVLNLNDNKLPSVPDEIGDLTALRTLYLNGNELTDLPSQIAGLTQLEFLYIQNNQLTSIFGPICDLDLKVFDRDDTVQCNYP